MQKYRNEIENRDMKQTGMEFFLQTPQKYKEGTSAHIHEAIEVICVIDCAFDVTINGTAYTLEAGDLILFRSNDVHTLTPIMREGKKGSYYVLKLKPSILFELASKENAAGYVLRFLVDRGNDKTLWRRQELEQGQIGVALGRLIDLLEKDSLCQDVALKLYATLVVLEMLRDMIRHEQQNGGARVEEDRTEEQICRAIRYIHLHYADPNLDAKTCGKAVGMSYSYFSRCFGRAMGKSFREYLNRVRLNHADHLLKTTNQSITEIAFACGYNSDSYFIRTYRKANGKTPHVGRTLQ